MSGGDLDGDVYMLIWDQEIVQGVKDARGAEGMPEPASDETDEAQKEQLTEDIGAEGYGIADTLCGYFKRDKLGQMSNLHLTLAIEHGVDSEPAMKAAYLCSIQVDFAKHGRCIKLEAMRDLQTKSTKGRPRFLVEDAEDDQVFDTDHVIQKLYDQVDLGNLFKKCLEVEHKFSILHDYELNKHIIDLADLKNVLHLSQYFKELYLQFVHPMETDLKEKLLKKFRLVNEGELFCSDFRYRFTDSQSFDYIGFLGKSNEDTISDITRELDDLIKVYRDKYRKFYKAQIEEAKVDKLYKEFLEAEKKAEEQKNSDSQSSKSTSELNQKNKIKTKIVLDLARALYFVSYFHGENPSCKAFLREVENLTDEDPEFNRTEIQATQALAEMKSHAQRESIA